MNPMYLFCRFLLLCLFFFSLNVPARAQFRDARLEWKPAAMNAAQTIDGYYQSLPAGYSNNTALYPLLVYLHGDESVEDGYKAILNNGIPNYISTGTFPERFQVGGNTHSFIVIAPHYTTKSLPPDALDDAIHFITQKFRVDPDRIYLTGMSRGGAYTWNYAGANAANATSLAAIVPVANAVAPDRDKAAVIGRADLPVWATHNDGDYLVPATNTTTYVDWVNAEKPQPRAEVTIFKSNLHEGWTQTYDPNAKFKGKNIYEWMLQYTRSSQIPLPVTLTSFVASAAGTQVTIRWTTTGEATGVFTLERSATQTHFTPIATLNATQQSTYSYIDQTPLPGANYYRLVQTEPDGLITYFQIVKVVVDAASQPTLTLHPNPVAGQSVLQLTTGEEGAVIFKVFTAGGRLVQHWTVQKQAGTWQQTVPFTKLPPGSYILQAKGQLHQHAIPFLKK